MAIAAVMWDYGGVFMASPFAAVADVARELGVEPQRYVEIIFGPYDRDTSHPWHRLERGELSLALAREEIIELGRSDGVDADPLLFFAAMAREGAAAVRDPVVELARRIKSEGVATALVTNNVVEFREHWKRSIPLDDLFHEVIDSSEVGLRKPDPKIFELALERLGGVEPGDAVFLDDYEGNVEAARRVGIHGIHVGEDYAAALAELSALLPGGGVGR
ncbi:MAG: HAD family phosphatase [Myxococcota bacterium]|nr:HAD family phosphatase [Myxococcota bacterium]